MMKLQPECVDCIVAQVKTVTRMLALSPAAGEAAMQDTLAYLEHVDYNGCTPKSMGELWQILLGHTDSLDPYAEIKARCNEEAMKIAPATREKIAKAADPLGTALKYAIAGNLIDYGLEHPVSIEEQNEQIDRIAHTPFSRDDSGELFEKLRHAKHLLYLGDNAGEVVFDRLLIERIKQAYPALDIAFAVKGSAVLNDVTRADAISIGMDQVARVLENGDGAPGTLLPKTSEAFQKEFWQADVVLSKGQGNYESLTGIEKENLYFLFTAKCNPICAAANVPKLSIVCVKNSPEPAAQT